MRQVPLRRLLRRRAARRAWQAIPRRRWMVWLVIRCWGSRGWHSRQQRGTSSPRRRRSFSTFTRKFLQAARATACFGTARCRRQQLSHNSHSAQPPGWMIPVAGLRQRLTSRNNDTNKGGLDQAWIPRTAASIGSWPTWASWTMRLMPVPVVEGRGEAVDIHVRALGTGGRDGEHTPRLTAYAP